MSQQISAIEVWSLLKTEQQSFLIDVRTEPEWRWVGVPDLSALGKELIQISLLLYPEMNYNPSFISELINITSDRQAYLIFICKTGGRSSEAAALASQIGFSNVYNLSNGFEGDLDEYGHRSSVNGWRKEGLPWRQK